MDVKKPHKVAICILFAGRAFLGLFPLLWAVYIVPDVTFFIKELGQELSPVTKALFKYSVACGIICSAVNFAYPAWHYVVKRRKTHVFDSNVYWAWVIVTNCALIIWLMMAIFQPLPMCTFGSRR